MTAIDNTKLYDAIRTPTQARVAAQKALGGSLNPILIPMLPPSIANIGIPDIGPGDIAIVCGPLGHGKTTYVRAVIKRALHVLAERNASGMDSISRYVFLMSTEETADAAIHGMADGRALRATNADNLSAKSIAQVFNAVEGLPLVVARPQTSIEEGARIMRAIEETSGAKPGLFAVDYLQMLRVENGRGTEVEKVNAAVEAVLELTQLLDCPSLIAAQAALSCLANADKFPDKEHAMWSRRIAELAPIFIGLLNPRELRDPTLMRQTQLSNGQIVVNAPDTLLLKARKLRHSDAAHSLIWLRVERPSLEMTVHPAIEADPTYFDYAAMMARELEQESIYEEDLVEF